MQGEGEGIDAGVRGYEEGLSGALQLALDAKLTAQKGLGADT